MCATWLPARETSFEGEDEYGYGGENRSSKKGVSRASRKAVFLTPEMCQQFLRQMRDGEACETAEDGSTNLMQQMGGGREGASGVLQEFVVPAGASNFVVRALEQGLELDTGSAVGEKASNVDVSLAVRTNRYTLVPRRYLLKHRRYREQQAALATPAS